MKLYKYLEIKEYNGTVIKRIDFSTSSNILLNKIEKGINIALNHEKYYTFTFDSEIKLKEIN